MKRIHAYRQLLGAVPTTNVQDLSKLYKGLMKTYHPDRFPNEAELREEAEMKSKEIIEAGSSSAPCASPSPMERSTSTSVCHTTPGRSS